MKGEGVGRPSIHGATHPHPALRAGLSLPGRGVSLLLRWEQTAAFCPLTPPTCTLPPGNVGATRWVARSVRRVHWDRVGSCGADVHNGGRATHRVAPTSPAYSHARYANEHGTATGVSVVGAVREPPPTTRHVASGPATGSPGSVGVPRMQRTGRDGRRERAWYMRSCAPLAGNVGATRWVARRGRGGRSPGIMRSHDDTIHPHPALRAGLSLPGRGVFSLPCNCDVQTVTPSHQATSTPLPRPG